MLLALRSSSKMHFIGKKLLEGGCKNLSASLLQFFVRQARSFITQHKWAWPFMHPVDVEGLGLHDYYEVIEKPMDFSTIKNKMDGKDGTGYRNVREIYADVRLVFKNAMKYNDERDDVHVMAKSLLEKFEEKWLQLLPKVMEEEKRQEEEEAKAQLDMQLTQEAVQTNKAKELRSELNEVDMQLENLRETVIQKCRKMSTEEKKNLGTALTRLSPEDLCKALEIVAENNPSFHATAQEVDLDMDAQVFVQESLKAASRSSGDMGGNNNNNNDDNNNEKDNSNKKNKNNPKRKKEICDALAKPAVKRTKKLPPNT
ncbi:transcription factor GTE1 isoform X3 [Citrus clementina]|uniref:transcription factor GTE1 isoform X3 n=1 Tax=Citrus clementina TaxID=85681 RepID=UPI000CECFDFB|nr:transcription factor GTE1 isoform X3 [Citrus x clementina]